MVTDLEADIDKTTDAPLQPTSAQIKLLGVLAREYARAGNFNEPTAEDAANPERNVTCGIPGWPLRMVFGESYSEHSVVAASDSLVTLGQLWDDQVKEARTSLEAEQASDGNASMSLQLRRDGFEDPAAHGLHLAPNHRESCNDPAVTTLPARKNGSSAAARLGRKPTSHRSNSWATLATTAPATSTFNRDYWEFEVSDFVYPRDPDEWFKCSLAAGRAIPPGQPLVCPDPPAQSLPDMSISLIRQSASCQQIARNQKISLCLACVRRRAGDGCRFENTRFLLSVKRGSSEEYVEGPAFKSTPDHSDVDRHQFAPPHMHGDGLALDTESRDFILRTIINETATVFLDILKAERKFMADFGEGQRADEPMYACSSQQCLLRRPIPGVRELCDRCNTSIWAGFYFCTLCGYAMCNRCFIAWDDSPINKPVMSSEEHNKLPTPQHSLCKRRRLGYGDIRVVEHVKRQFLRASLFTTAEIDLMICKIEQAITQYPPQPTESLEPAKEWIDTLIAHNQRLGWLAYSIPPQLEEWERPVIRVSVDELTVGEFSRLWRSDNVIVVTGLLDRLNLEQWTPQWLSKIHGDEKVEILDCARWGATVGVWKLKHFFKYFDHDVRKIDTSVEGATREGVDLDEHSGSEGEYERQRATPLKRPTKRKRSQKEMNELQLSDMTELDRRTCLKNGILKIKDWPPKDNFKDRLPDHFEDYMKVLPFPPYTTPGGLANLASWLPKGACPPDLGPKMYLAYGSSDTEGGHGTTNLHCDMADAANLMVYCSKDFLRSNKIPIPGIWTPDMDGDGSDTATAANPESEELKPAAAVWDIYPPDALPTQRKFLREYNASIGFDIGDVDVIHNQSSFLTTTMRQQLYNYDSRKKVRGWRVYQNPGDAVFVPAGCSHQVCNYANAIKVAVDFVSPERTRECRRVTEEFRKLPHSHPRSMDALQLNNMLWYTWLGLDNVDGHPPPIPLELDAKDQSVQARRKTRTTQKKPKAEENGITPQEPKRRPGKIRRGLKAKQELPESDNSNEDCLIDVIMSGHVGCVKDSPTARPPSSQDATADADATTTATTTTNVATEVATNLLTVPAEIVTSQTSAQADAPATPTEQNGHNALDQPGVTTEDTKMDELRSGTPSLSVITDSPVKSSSLSPLAKLGITPPRKTGIIGIEDFIPRRSSRRRSQTDIS